MQVNGNPHGALPPKTPCEGASSNRLQNTGKNTRTAVLACPRPVDHPCPQSIADRARVGRHNMRTDASWHKKHGTWHRVSQKSPLCRRHAPFCARCLRRMGFITAHGGEKIPNLVGSREATAVGEEQMALKVASLRLSNTIQSIV